MKEVYRTWPYFETIIKGFSKELADYDFILSNLVENEETFTKGLGV
jgi:hypothetical protein